MKSLCLILVLACAACTTSHPLTSCRGTYQPANPGKWVPTTADLASGANQ